MNSSNANCDIHLLFLLLLQSGDNGTFMDLNLFNSRGDHWKMLRHTMSPTFSTGKIKAVSIHIAYEFNLKPTKGKQIDLFL